MLVPARRLDPEWMDREDNAAPAVEGALRDIRIVNRWLGGLPTLLFALDPHLRSLAPGEVLQVLDVGTGGGDLPLAMARRARQLGKRIRVVAVDRDASAARAAWRETRRSEDVTVVRADAMTLPFPERSFDVVAASMFLHHFDGATVASLLRRFRRLARRAVLVNDLRRHLVPWAFIRLAARATRRHPMFVHDAPLSVLKGFTPSELLQAAREAGAAGARIRRRWPFRLLLTVPADGFVP